jgi:hypothetical protein
MVRTVKGRSRVKRVAKLVGLSAVVVGAGIQFIPVKEIGTNPRERFALDAPPEVATISRNACFDCHTNEARWPVYSRIAPGSWLMARDIHEGRTHLNFSEWGSVDEESAATISRPPGSGWNPERCRLGSMCSRCIRRRGCRKATRRNSRATSFATPKRRNQLGPRTFQKGNRTARRDAARVVPTDAQSEHLCAAINRSGLMGRVRRGPIEDPGGPRNRTGGGDRRELGLSRRRGGGSPRFEDGRRRSRRRTASCPKTGSRQR